MCAAWVPAFIDLSESEQVQDLRAYLKSLGAEISEENSDQGLVYDLAKIIDASGIVWKQATEPDAEAVLNSIISLIFIIPTEQVENMVISFIEKVFKGEKHHSLQMRVLSNLFHGLDERSSLRYNVYCALVKVAGHTNNIDMIETDISKIQKWVCLWDLSIDNIQNLYRLLYEALLEVKCSEEASKVMFELLGTYTDDNASQARSEAHRCIVSCIADPKVLILDGLLQLKPVKFLEGELIHDLLTIFVSGKLEQYQAFYKQNTDFISSLGLDHEANLQKMRLLTFMSMAESKRELPFDLISQEMKISSDEVESFIIDVIATKKVICRIDQKNRKVNVSYCTQRTFSKQNWVQLKETLQLWKGNLINVQDHLASVATT